MREPAWNSISFSRDFLPESRRNKRYCTKTQKCFPIWALNDFMLFYFHRFVLSKIKIGHEEINLNDKIVKRQSSVTESARFFLSLDKIYLFCSFLELRTLLYLWVCRRPGQAASRAILFSFWAFDQSLFWRIYFTLIPDLLDFNSEEEEESCMVKRVHWSGRSWLVFFSLIVVGKISVSSNNCLYLAN